jgi:hypothetical protein
MTRDNTMRAMRRIGTIIAVVLAIALSTTSADATPNWGFNGINDSCCVINGIRAGIESPGRQLSLPDNGVMAQAAFAQANTPDYSYAGLIQIGMAQTGSVAAIPGCGTHTDLFVYMEYKPFSPYTDDYVCQEQGLVIGTAVINLRYSVMHNYDPYAGQGYWSTFLEGYLQASFNVGFAAATKAHGGAELNNDSSFLAIGETEACYGCGGATTFSRSSLAYGDPAYDPSTSWTDINQADRILDDVRWVVDWAPSPFSVYHPY